jgi:sugar lactone lactonase YvrE
LALAESQVRAPEGITIDPEGRVVFSDYEGERVDRIESDGSLTVLVGTGAAGLSGDGGPATNATLSEPIGIAFDASGNLLIVDSHDQRVREVTPDGLIATIAGSGPTGQGMGHYGGDGGPAVDASFNDPQGIALLTDDGIAVADHVDHRVRRIDSQGLISTIAGNGEGDYIFVNGNVVMTQVIPVIDGSMAVNAALSAPGYLISDRAGGFYVGDRVRQAVFHVLADGTIHWVAGIGHVGFSGDKGPARLAVLRDPNGLALGNDGSLYIVDSGNNRIRRVGPDGTITTVAGNGKAAFSGDGGPATKASLKAPTGIAIDPQGRLVVADQGNGRVRRIDADGTISTIAGG